MPLGIVEGSPTQRELCKDLKYDVLALTETHDEGTLKGTRNFIPGKPAPETDSFSGVALLLSDRVAKCVTHTGNCGSRIVYARIKEMQCDLFTIGVYVPHKSSKNNPYPSDTISRLEDQTSVYYCSEI